MVPPFATRIPRTSPTTTLHSRRDSALYRRVSTSNGIPDFARVSPPTVGGTSFTTTTRDLLFPAKRRHAGLVVLLNLHSILGPGRVQTISSAAVSRCLKNRHVNFGQFQ